MCLLVCKGSSGAVAYQQTFSRFLGGGSRQVRYDAHLSAPNHCSEWQDTSRLGGRQELVLNFL
ncbi:hypothetical protein EVAR_91359_1, partial [Eumeta japonica]